MKLKNLYKGLKYQTFHSMVISRNGWGMFHKNSHINQRSGKPKVMYNTLPTALKSAQKMQEKYGGIFRPYKCIYCDGYHIGKNISK